MRETMNDWPQEDEPYTFGGCLVCLLLIAGFWLFLCLAFLL